jgi:predicted amidohydrolase YtcJ
LDSLKKYAVLHPEKKWILGENLWLAAFLNGNPLKSTLDSIFPDRPVYISSMDGHNAWVNSKALRIAGITKETPDPINGKIERWPGTKEPSGTLRENAMDLVRQHLPAYTDEDRNRALIKAIELANSFGLTTLNEASAGIDYIKAYYRLEKENKLNVHINISIYCDISKGVKEAGRVIDLRDSLMKLNSKINPNQVKLFMDGVVEGKTAAMLDNYTDDHHHGATNAPYDTALAVILELDKAGMQIHVHAIGDRAIRTTLDGIETALNTNGKKTRRHHIAHLQVIHPNDMSRFKSLDVIANFQALWATWEDTYMTELNRPFLGNERMEWQYPIGTVHKTGARIAFGSDWDVSTQNPFYAIQVAVNRRGPDSIKRDPWTPQHRINLHDVIKGYTANGAYLTYREKETGTLEKGKWADIIVLDQDIFNVDQFAIYKTKVLKTFFKGKLVYEK